MSLKNVIYQMYTYGYLITLNVILASNCTINLETDMYGKYYPMIVTLHVPVKYLHPEPSNPENLVIGVDESIGIFCPGFINLRYSNETIQEGTVKIGSENVIKSNEVIPIRCNPDGTFHLENDLNNKSYDVEFNQVYCYHIKNKFASSVLLEDDTPNCLKGRRYQIGYSLYLSGFLRIIDLCFNEDEAKTLWAHSVITPATFKAPKDTRTNGFKSGILFRDIKMSSNAPYSKMNQQKRINTILGLEEHATDYIHTAENSTKYLARGHLIANADKIYRSEQESTFYYANVVPMWQVINTGSWYKVEKYVRKLAFCKNQELDVWAGGIGVLKLRGEEIHLYHDEELGAKIPVPKILYKCVVDKKANASICFLVVNNPFVTETELKRYKVCNELKACRNIDDIQVKEGNLTYGYLYCCTLSNFYKRNHEELGLDDLFDYQEYKQMKLVPKIHGNDCFQSFKKFFQ